jgi:hypothetical protein
MGALLSIPLFLPGITGMGGWALSCCGAAAVCPRISQLTPSVPLSADHVGHVPPASPPESLMRFSFSSTRW